MGGGALLFAHTIQAIRERIPQCGVEVLVPDFSGHRHLLDDVIASRPEAFAHNIETVERIFRRIRPGFRYERSLQVLHHAKRAGMITKSNLILGMGEEDDEILKTMHDLRHAECDLLTITQYLRPSARHLPVSRWVKPGEFEALQKSAQRLGFSAVMSGPLVRSSYRAGRMHRHAIGAHPADQPSQG